VAVVSQKKSRKVWRRVVGRSAEAGRRTRTGNCEYGGSMGCLGVATGRDWGGYK